MSAASKARWREKNPERRRAHERERADRRRNGAKRIVDTPRGPVQVRDPDTASSSYSRYEYSLKRYLTRLRHRIGQQKARLDAALTADPWLAQVDAWLAGQRRRA